MKREQFIQELTRAGCYFKRPGKRHDLYENPITRRLVPVPRHREIRNSLCDLIRRQLGLK